MLRLVLVISLLPLPGLVAANPIPSLLPGAEMRGKATFRFLGLPMYEARLFTVGGEPLNWRRDFGLELNYYRRLTQRDLVLSTLKEMDRTGPPVPVRDQLERCFDDVRRGDRYLAITNGRDEVMFWRNGTRTCTLAYPDIKQRFMAIFLGDNTRSKSFTRRLKGQ